MSLSDPPRISHSAKIFSSCALWSTQKKRHGTIFGISGTILGRFVPLLFHSIGNIKLHNLFEIPGTRLEKLKMFSKQILRVISAELLTSMFGNNLAISRRCYKPMYVAPYLRELRRRKDVQLKKLGDFSTPRSKYIEWNLQAEIYAFGKRLGEEFDQELLKRAFTHKSYIQQELEQRKSLGIEDSALALEDNEEFIKKGDRIVSDTVAKYIKNALPRASTVFHKSLETYLCSTATLATSSNLIGSKDIILSNEYPPSEELLANTFKAIVFALEESSGIEKARQFVVDLLIVQIAHKDIYEIWNPKNPMGIVCEELESQKRALPESRLMRQTGGNTILGVFQVGLYSDRKLIGQGFGETPEIAETMSAHDALRKMYGLEEKMLPLPFGKKAERLVL